MATTYKIGEAAALLNLKTYVLRFWETEFPHIVPLRTDKGQRLYTEENLALLERIRFLLHERGLTIEGARKILNEDREKGVTYVFTPGAAVPFALADEAESATDSAGPDEEGREAGIYPDNDPDAAENPAGGLFSQYNLPGISKTYPIHEKPLFERPVSFYSTDPPAAGGRERLADGADHAVFSDDSRFAADGQTSSFRQRGAARDLLRGLAAELESIAGLLRGGV